MSKIKFWINLFIFLYLSNTYASISVGIQKIATGKVQEGVEILEQDFENSSANDQARISLILSRIKDAKMENSPVYYAKYALKFLTKSLTPQEVIALNVDLGDYDLSIGNLTSSKKYYFEALKNNKNDEVSEYINYRLAWVMYNDGKTADSESYLNKVLDSKVSSLRDDAIYLLGKIVVDNKSSLVKYQSHLVLKSESFLKGLNENTGSFNLNPNLDDFTKFYLSVHTKVNDSCTILSKEKLNLPQDLEIEKELVQSYLKGCLVNDNSLVVAVRHLVLQHKWEDQYPKALALSYLMLGENGKSCSLYKKIILNDEQEVLGLLASCNSSEIDIKYISQIKTSCEQSFGAVQINEGVLSKLSAVNKIENQALLYNGLLQNFKSPHFEDLEKKLHSCSLQKNLNSSRYLALNTFPESSNVSDIYSKNCGENTQSMLSAAYMLHLNNNTNLDLSCVKSNLDRTSQMNILSKIDFTKVKKRFCEFELDCLITNISVFISNGGVVKTSASQKEFNVFIDKLNQLSLLDNEVKTKVSASNIERLYSKIVRVKKLFVKPLFFNEVLFKDLSEKHNSVIDNMITRVDEIKEFDESQKEILKKALLNERVRI